MAILLAVITFTPVKPALLYGFAGAAVIAIFAAAVALFTWWPNQKYQPIIHDTANREVDISQGNRDVGVSQSAREVGVSQGAAREEVEPSSRAAAREAGLTQAAVDRVEDSNVGGGYGVGDYEVSNPAYSQSQATPRTAANGETYVEVQPGDTLSGLAEVLGTTVDQLAVRNGIENPNLIYSGQLLYFPAAEQGLAGGVSPPTTGDAVTPSPLGANVLPTGGGAPIVAGPSSENGELGIPPRGPVGTATSSPAAVGGGGAYVVVQPGDTLPLIAELSGTTVDQLAVRNGIENPNLIYSGQLLYLP